MGYLKNSMRLTRCGAHQVEHAVPIHVLMDQVGAAIAVPILVNEVRLK